MELFVKDGELELPLIELFVGWSISELVVQLGRARAIAEREKDLGRFYSLRLTSCTRGVYYKP